MEVEDKLGCGKEEFKRDWSKFNCGDTSSFGEVLLCDDCKDKISNVGKRERDKLYSSKYRERKKNGEIRRIYKENKNTKKYKKSMERIEKLDKKIEELKNEKD